MGLGTVFSRVEKKMAGTADIKLHVHAVICGWVGDFGMIVSA